MEFKVGDKVRYIGNSHEDMPEYYPEKMTLGTIKSVCDYNCLVQWEEGSTSRNDMWSAGLDELLIVKKETVKFTPENLKTGHIVTFRNGFKARVYTNIDQFVDILINSKLSISIPIEDYTDTLTCIGNEEYDIVQVEVIRHLCDISVDLDTVKETRVIWERPVSRKLSRADIQKAFGCTDFVIEED